MINKYIYHSIQQVAVFLIIISFFLPIRLQTFLFIILLPLMGIIYLLHMPKIVIAKNEWLALLLITSLYSIYFLSFLLYTSDSHSVLYSFLERKITLLIIPCWIFIFKELCTHYYKSILKIFVYSNIVAGIVYIVTTYFAIRQDTPIQHVAFRDTFDKVSGFHPTYFGMYTCFSASVLYMMPLLLSRLKSILFHILLATFLIILSPKICLLFYLILSIYMIYNLPCKYQYKISIVLSATAIVYLLFYGFEMFHNRMSEWRFLFHHSHENILNNSISFRKIIYQIDFNLLKSHGLMGLGPDVLEQQLKIAYYHLSILKGVYVDTYNTHNEFVNYWLCFGFIGLVVLVAIFILHFYRAIKYKNKLYFCLTTLFLFVFLTENILSRQHGITFFAFFMPLFFVTSKKLTFVAKE